MKKAVVLKAVEFLNEIETIEKAIFVIKTNREILFVNDGNHVFARFVVNDENKVNNSSWFDNFSITKNVEEIIQEVTERYLSLLVIRLQAEQKRIEASLESFNEDDFYRSNLFTKMEEVK